MNIYVGNLPHATTDQQLREAFEEFGTVTSASIITDKFTGDSRGFGFVEMPDNGEAQEAIDALNEEDFGGRKLTVNEARPREKRSGGPGGGSGNRRPDFKKGGGGGGGRGSRGVGGRGDDGGRGYGREGGDGGGEGRRSY